MSKMRVLGYKVTWVTTCRLGCSAKVFAHTQGNGDFVLLDALGPPWKVDPCYESRRLLPDFRLDSHILEELDRIKQEIAKSEEDKYKKAIVLHPVRPEEYLGKGPFKKSGFLHFYREGRIRHFLGKLRAFDRAEAERIFGNRISELCIADAQGHLFTCYADMRNVVIAPGAEVEVEIRACKVPIPKLNPVFLCHSVGIRRSQRSSWA